MNADTRGAILAALDANDIKGAIRALLDALSNDASTGHPIPTQAEVQAHAEANFPGRNWRGFYDYNSSVGWCDSSGEPLRSWRHALAGWMARGRDQQTEQARPPVDVRKRLNQK